MRARIPFPGLLPGLLLASLFALAVPATAATLNRISSSNSHTLAIKSDGTVVAWGSDAYGALGQGREIAQPTPTVISIAPRIVQISPSLYTLYALDGQGHIWSWGKDDGTPRIGALPGKPSRIAGVDNVVRIDAGYNGLVALRNDGTVVCWGCGADGTALPAIPFAKVITGLSNIVSIAAGDGNVFALRSDGTLWAAGTNYYGELGDGSVNDRAAPYQVPGLSGVTKVVTARHSVLAMKSDGSVYRWGAGSHVGSTPALVTGIPAAVADVFCDNTAGLVLVDGSVRLFGSGISHSDAGVTGARQVATNGETGFFGSSIAYLDASGQVFASGGNFSGELGRGSVSREEPLAAVPGLTGVVSLKGPKVTSYKGGNFYAALTSDGKVRVWGSNVNGEQGNGTILERTVPVAVPGLANIVSVSAGDDFSLALTGTGTVYAWGFGGTFQLGDNNAINRSSPAPITSIANVTSIAAGLNQSLYVKSDTTLWYSGNADFPNDNCPTTCQIYSFGGSGFPITGVVAVAAARSSSYALRSNGSLVVFGDNSVGQLGINNNTVTSLPYPTAISPTPEPIMSIAATGYHVEVITTFNNLYAWGYNSSGQVGTGSVATAIHNPTLILTNIADVAVSESHTIALRTDGQVFAWGQSYAGQLGIGGTSTTARTSPQLVPDLAPSIDPLVRVGMLAAGNQRSFAVRGDGLVWAFGASIGTGSFGYPGGNLGDGTVASRRTPIATLSERPDANIEDAACTNNASDKFWYLDLVATSCTAVPAAKIPSTLTKTFAKNTLSGITVDSSLNVRRSDYGKTKKIYAFGFAPPEFLAAVNSAPGSETAAKVRAAKAGGLVVVQLTQAGWSLVSGQLSAYADGVLAADLKAIKLLESVPAPAIAGAKFCIGYGDSVDDMLFAQQLRAIVDIPGSTAVVTLPCLPAGTYLDGPSASLQGANVAFDATVIGDNPTGSVQFKDGAANLGAAKVLAAQTPAKSGAQYATSALAAGDHAITAAYGGDANPVNGASVSSVLTHTVLGTKGASAVALSGETSSTTGSPVEFKASVAGTVPSGTVVFYDGITSIGTVLVSGGVARITLDTLALGSHSITAQYSGDAANLASNSAVLTHTVISVAQIPVVAITSAPLKASTGVSIPIAVAISGTSPSGIVDIYDGATLLGTATLSGGAASVSVTFAAVGVRAIRASYRGDAGNIAASSGTVLIQIDPLDLTIDTDGDGIPDAIEAAEGRNPGAKDNDVFASNRLFAMQQYRDFLGREGDAGGVAAWVNYLNGGGMRAAVTEGFFGSGEFQGTGSPVVRLYFAYFLRIPDYGGLTFWMSYYRAGHSLVEISNAFAGSAEFVNRYGALTSSAFVDLVYQNVLGRAADATGKAFWLGQLSGGMTRGEMMTGFSESPEYQSTIFSETYVTMMYVGMLKRAPDDGGFTYWVNYLDAKYPGQALISGFLVSPEYRNRFLP